MLVHLRREEEFLDRAHPRFASHLRHRFTRFRTYPDASGRIWTPRTSEVVGTGGFEPPRAEALRILSPMGGVAYVRVKPDFAVVCARFASSLRRASIHRSGGLATLSDETTGPVSRDNPVHLREMDVGRVSG